MSEKKPLEGRTALVTGAARRLGKAFAVALASSGAKVVVHYYSSEKEAAETVYALREITDAIAIYADLADESLMDSLFAQARDAFGPINILVNSASIYPASTVWDSSADDFIHNFRINTFAPLYLSRLFAHQTESNTEGDIVNVIDSHIGDYDRNHVPYQMSKQNLDSLTRILAAEFAPQIKVNAIAPGLVLPADGETGQSMEKYIRDNPLEKEGKPGDVTSALMFLLSHKFITGQVLYIDGGRHMKKGLF